MATSFINIYEKAIAEISDPSIDREFASNSVEFCKTMYNYLDNAIPYFIIPTTSTAKMADIAVPVDVIELFDGTGLTAVFTLSSTPTADALFVYTDSGVGVSGGFNYNTNQVTLDFIPSAGTENVQIEWYSPGQFNQTLDYQEKSIIAQWLVVCWGEKEKNFLLDIRRLLNDDDFKLSAEGNNMVAKGNWFYAMREKAEKNMNNYSWQNYFKIPKTLR